MAKLRQQGFGDQSSIIKVRQENYAVQRQNEPVVNAVNQASAHPLLSGNIIDGELFFPSGIVFSRTLRLRHQLGREYRGWMLVRNSNVFMKVSESATFNERPDEILLLSALQDSAPIADLSVPISVLVF